MQCLLANQYLIFDADNGKKFHTKNVQVVAPKSVCTFMIFIEIGLYSLIKINISEWLINY